MQFRKRPVVVEAFQWTGTECVNLYGDGLPTWVQPFLLGCFTKDSPASFINCPIGEFPTGRWYLKIHVLGGEVEVAPGDWIILGVRGEIYPCKPDIFQQTYEPVEEWESLSPLAIARKVSGSIGGKDAKDELGQAVDEAFKRIGVDPELRQEESLADEAKRVTAEVLDLAPLKDDTKILVMTLGNEQYTPSEHDVEVVKAVLQELVMDHRKALGVCDETNLKNRGVVLCRGYELKVVDRKDVEHER